MATQKKTGRRSAVAKKDKGTSSPIVADLLLEIGIEEHPYQFIAPALASLKESYKRIFNDQRFTLLSVRTIGTSRRLTIAVDGLAERQASMVKEVMGPSKTIAFDQ